MQSYLMAHVCDIGLFRSKSSNKRQRAFEILMRKMRLMAQGIDNQCIKIKQPGIFLFVHREHVGYVCEIADAVTDDRQAVMPHPDRVYFNIENPKRRECLDGIERQVGYSGLGLLRETIKEPLVNDFEDIRFGIYRDRIVTGKIPKFVEPRRVVIMFVGYQHTIYLTKWDFKHLKIKIRPAIN